MKQLSVFLALLLALTPVALASEEEAKEACRDAPDQDACVERWCESNGCEDKNETRTHTAPSDRPESRPEDRSSNQTAREADRAHPTMLRDGFDGRWIDFSIRDGRVVDYTVDGTLVLTSIAVQGTVEKVHRDGARIRVELDEGRFIMTDSRTGLIAFEGEGLVLSFPNGTTFSERGERHLVAGPGFMGAVDGEHLVIDGATVTAEELKFSVVPGQQRAREVQQDVAQAIQERRVAAEVRIDRDDDEVLAYDDVNITVESADDHYRVVFDADLDSGRTFVLDVDPSVLAGPDLDLRYFDVHESGAETEVVFRVADSLIDILDATDDGGQPEYWVVEDADGLQVMVSIPHWSVHAITIQGVGAFLTQPSVLLGAGAGVFGVAVAAIIMLRPRKD